MRHSVYYLTMSVDGFIADSKGSVDWMTGAPNVDYGFSEFYDSVGTILLGARTYEHMLKMGDFFPYMDKEVIVTTSNEKLRLAGENVQLSHEDPAKTLARLQLGDESEGIIWVGGGGALAGSLFAAGLIDELRIFIQPVILGSGTKALSLFTGALIEESSMARALELQYSKDHPAGIVELRYHVPKRWRSDL